MCCMLWVVWVPRPDQANPTPPQNRTDRPRLEAGLLLREAKELWRTGLDLACVEEMARRRLGLDSSPGADAAAAAAAAAEPPGAVVGRYAAACARVKALGLEGVWQLRPLLDGKALIGALGLPKVRTGDGSRGWMVHRRSYSSHATVHEQGPLVGKAMTEQVRWQIKHPEGTKEEALAHLKAFVAAAGEGEGGRGATS